MMFCEKINPFKVVGVLFKCPQKWVKYIPLLTYVPQDILLLLVL